MLPPHRARTDPGPRPRTDPNRSDDGNAKYDRLHEWAAERDGGAQKTLLWIDKACSMLPILHLPPSHGTQALISTCDPPCVQLTKRISIPRWRVSPFSCQAVSTFSCWPGPHTRAACGVSWCVIALPFEFWVCVPHAAHRFVQSARSAFLAGAVRLCSHGRHA